MSFIFFDWWQIIYPAGHINHSIFWKNLAPTRVSLLFYWYLFRYNFWLLALPNNWCMTGRRWRTPTWFSRSGYWNRFWLIGKVNTNNERKRCCCTRIWMGGKLISLLKILKNGFLFVFVSDIDCFNLFTQFRVLCP